MGVHSCRTIQLTDGGPSATPELPSRVPGPPFGEAPGSASGLLKEKNAWKTARY